MQLDLRAILEADSRRRRQMVDVVTERLLGRDAPRRRVRLAQVAAVFELGHQVAHHRGAHAQLMVRDYLRRSDRLGSRDKLLHGREDQRMLPVRERVGFLRHLIWRVTRRGPVTILLPIQRYIQATIVTQWAETQDMASRISLT